MIPSTATAVSPRDGTHDPAVTLLSAGIAAYVLLQLAIGWLASRRVRTESDYLLAGRRLGLPLVSLSVFATWFGAETCVGSAGAVHAQGLSGSTAEPFGYALCLVIMALVYAARLRERGYTTLADLFRERFSPRVEKLAVALMVPTSVLWAGAQVRAFGQVLGHATGLGLPAAIVLAASVAVIYTVLGGLYADAVTDLLQGLVLIVGLVALLALVLERLGGLSALTEIDPARLSLVAPKASALTSIEAWVVPVVGSLFAQELAARALAARTPGVARLGTLLAAMLYFVVGLIPILLGLVGGQAISALDDPERILPTLAERLLPTAGYVVFVGALISAILSTVDSTLLVSASLISHNVVAALHPDATERAKVRSARIAVVAFGAIAALLALSAGSVVELVEQASAFGGAGLAVAGTMGLFSAHGGPRTATATLLVGAASFVVLGPGLGTSAPFTASLLASVATWTVVAWLDRSPTAAKSASRDGSAGDAHCVASSSRDR